MGSGLNLEGHGGSLDRILGRMREPLVGFEHETDVAWFRIFKDRSIIELRVKFQKDRSQVGLMGHEFMLIVINRKPLEINFFFIYNLRF